MPTSLRIGPYRFFFYASGRGEPPHTHVAREEKEAEENKSQLKESWNEFFNPGN